MTITQFPFTTHTQPDQLPSTPELVDALVSIGGNLPLLAENYGTTTTHLTTLLSTPEATALLKTRIETRTLLNTFRLLELSTDHVQSVIPVLDPRDLVRLHTGLLSSITTTTTKPANTTLQNTMQVVFNSLPPQVQEALTLLNADAEGRGLVIEGDATTITTTEETPPHEGQ